MGRLEIRFLGTGNAFNLDGRGSPCIWIEPASSAPFLVDAGPTAMSAMLREDLDPQLLDRLVITHLHGDHIAGWPFLLLHFAVPEGRSRPFDILGPVGIRERLEGLVGLCFDRSLERPGFEINYHELVAEARSGLQAGDGVVLDRVPLRHHASSLGYRIHVEGLRVAVSGDTGWCPNLEALAAPSDLSILECSTRVREADTHLSLEEIRSGRDRLGDGEIVLVHLTDDVAEELAVDPIPGVIAAHDGMIWSRPMDGPATS